MESKSIATSVRRSMNAADISAKTSMQNLSDIDKET